MVSVGEKTQQLSPSLISSIYIRWLPTDSKLQLQGSLCRHHAQVHTLAFIYIIEKKRLKNYCSCSIYHRGCTAVLIRQLHVAIPTVKLWLVQLEVCLSLKHTLDVRLNIYSCWFLCPLATDQNHLCGAPHLKDCPVCADWSGNPQPHWVAPSGSRLDKKKKKNGVSPLLICSSRLSLS